MNSNLIRWIRFNAVGILGFALQLAVLRLLQVLAPHWTAAHPMLASNIAVELTLLHNFAWHRGYTWRERCRTQRWWPQCIRFHLCNGAISLLGSAVVVHLLAHTRLLVANVIAVLACSVANFFAGNDWVFRTGHGEQALEAPQNECYSGYSRNLFPCRCIDRRVHP